MTPDDLDRMTTEDHHWNPCTHGRYPFLAPVGDFLARFSPDCPCCSTVRWGLISILAFVVGLLLG